MPPVQPRFKPSSAHRLFYHFVFRTKNSRRILTGEIAAAVRRKILEICEERGYRLIHCKVQPEHVHLLLKLRPADSLPLVAQMLKGRTAHDLLQDHPELGDFYTPTGERNFVVKGVLGRHRRDGQGAAGAGVYPGAAEASRRGGGGQVEGSGGPGRPGGPGSGSSRP